MAKSERAIPDSMRENLGNLAERLGRIAATVQNKAEELLDRQALRDDVTSVRNAAASLLEQLAGSDAPAKAKKASIRAASAAKSSANTKARSGGFVDAPGHKHRKPVPSLKGRITDSRTAKLKMRHDSAPRRTSQSRG